MKKYLLIIFIFSLLSGCTLNNLSTQKKESVKTAQVETAQVIVTSSNCTDCAVSGTLYLPEHSQPKVEVKITLFEFDPTIADVAAKESDKIDIYVNQDVKEINFNIGEKGNISNSKKYYIDARGYADKSYIFWGKCSHGDFCQVLGPDKIEIDGIMQK